MSTAMRSHAQWARRIALRPALLVLLTLGVPPAAAADEAHGGAPGATHAPPEAPPAAPPERPRDEAVAHPTDGTPREDAAGKPRRRRSPAVLSADAAEPPKCAEPVPQSLQGDALVAELVAHHADIDALAAERERLLHEWGLLAAARLDLELARAEVAGAIPPAGEGQPGGVPEAPPPTRSDEETAKVSATVKSMKPEKAAAVIARLEPGLGAAVLRGMSRPAAAGILENIQPDLAAELVRRLTERRPKPPASKPVEQAAPAPLTASAASAAPKGATP